MNSELIRVLLLEDNPGDARLVREALHDADRDTYVVVQAGRVGDASRMLQSQYFHVLLLDLTLPDSSGLATFELIHAQAPDLPTVLLTGIGDDDLAMQAIRQGAQDYLVKGEVSAETLVRTIRHAVERHRLQAELLKQTERPPGRVISFLGAKGGVGATTVALNVAAALAARGQNVLAAELRAWPGSFSTQFGPPAAGHLGHLLDLHPDAIKPRQIGGRLVHLSSGLRLLHGPQLAGEPREVGVPEAEALIQALASMADVTVLDLPFPPTAAVQAAARSSYLIVLVVEREPAAVASARTLLDGLGAWGISRALVRVVVVDCPGLNPALDSAAIEAQLDCPVIGTIPECAAALSDAMSAQSALVVHQPEHEAAVALDQIAQRLSTDRSIAVSA